MEDNYVYVVCNSSVDCYPRNILRIFKSLPAAQRFLGKYVSELEESTYTGYLTIAKKRVGNYDDMHVYGIDRED